MHHFLRRGMALLLLIAMLISILPSVFAAEAGGLEVTEAAETTSTVVPVENDDLTYSGKKILAYRINPSNFTISDTNIDRLTARGVTDLYVLTKGELGTLDTTNLTNVISYAGSGVRVHAWVMCGRDNAYLSSNPTHAAYHFRVGYNNNAHSSSSSYYDTRNGFVNLGNTSYQSYFNKQIDTLEAIDGLAGIHLDSTRYGADYYGWGSDLKSALGTTYYNTLAQAMCAQNGYTYSTGSDGYYAFKGTTTADGTSFKTLLNENGAAAQAFREYRENVVTGFVKSVKDNLASGLTLSVSLMPEAGDTAYGKAIYGQSAAKLAPYVDYVVAMSYFGDFYEYNDNAYDTKFPATIAKQIAKEGCNVVAGIQGYAFENTDTSDSSRNGYNPSGYEARTQAEYINDARREVNGDPTYGGDILGAAVFRSGTSAQVKISYNQSAGTVSFSLVAGATAIKSIRIRLYNGFYVDKSKCTVSGTSYTYNSVTYTAGGTASDSGYYYQLTVDASVSAYATKTLTIPVCDSTGSAITGSYNNEHFAAYVIYSSTTKGSATYLPIYQQSYVNSTHTSCTFTKTTPQPATCLAAGYNLYTCATCGYDYAEYVAQLSHSYTATVVAPTCTTAGYTVNSCTNGCNDTYNTSEVAALGHSYVDAVTGATCTESGYTTHTCSVCQDSYTDAVVPALGHSYGNGEITTAATCTDAGVKTFTCAVCNHSYTEEIEALGHNYTDVVVPPTCTEQGYTIRTCAECEDVIIGEYVNTTGHNYVQYVTLPTCEEGGYTTFVCECGDSYVSDYTSATGHNYDTTIYAPTCTERGYTVYTCVCGDSFIMDYVKATGHSYVYTDNGENHIVTCENCDYNATEAHSVEGAYCSVCSAFLCDHSDTEIIVDTEATCTTDGAQHTYCNGCSTTLSSEVIPATGHNAVYVSDVAATCTASGTRHHWKCENCAQTFSDEACNYAVPASYLTIAVTGHSSVYVAATAATCTATGNRQHWKCENCSQTFSDEACNYAIPASYLTIAVTGHSTVLVAATAATCTTDGNRQHWKCENCSQTFSDEAGAYAIPASYVTIAATGHSYEIKTVAATCTEDGYILYTCSACGDSYTTNGEAAFGHTYVYNDNGDNHIVSCSNCDYSASEAHSYVDGACICGAVEATEPEYELDTNLSFIMSISAGAEMQVRYTILNAKVSSFDSFYLVVTKAVADGEPVVTTFELDAMTPVTNTGGAVTAYQATYAGINAKEMGDEFATVLYAVASDGTIHYSATNTNSMKSYLVGKIDAESSIAELKTMCVDMLNYGAAAQIRLGYNTENLVNADLTEEQKALATQEIPEAVNNIATSTDGSKLISSVSLQSKVLLYLNSNYAGTDASTLKYVIKDAESGETLDTLDVTQSGSFWQAVYSNVGAKQMRQLLTITLYDGDTAVSQTLTWSIESYVASVREKTTSTEAEINMVNAMLTYGDSVAAYMTASGQ